MRRVDIQVGGSSVGRYITWGYPKGSDAEHFWTPVYPCTVTGTDDSGQSVSQRFDVLRFGVQNKDGHSPRVVGLAEQQTHVIKAWLPHYRVHSANSPENGAWQVYDNFLIHDGPDDDNDNMFATIGCVEIMGPKGFVRFNDLIIALSGASANDRDAKLHQIGGSGHLFVTYERAERPKLERVR